MTFSATIAVRPLLFDLVHRAHAAFANEVQHAVATEHRRKVAVGSMERTRGRRSACLRTGSRWSLTIDMVFGCHCASLLNR